MKMCPVCNSFQTLQKQCPFCQDMLIDAGRITDYLDPYGHYYDFETRNLADPSYNKERCSHLVYCDTCHYDEVAFIEEQLL